MKQICKATGIEFEITPEDLAFYQKVSPKIGGKVYEIPPPTLCPEERQRRRLAWRNRRNILFRKCDASHHMILSMYPPVTKFPVYKNEYWYSDHYYDPLAYGRDFDFSRPFFDQFSELRDLVPHASLEVTPGVENSDFCNGANDLKNCYLVFCSAFCENVMYSHFTYHSNSCLDCIYTDGSELCYECIDCINCYDVRFSQQVKSCSESSFLWDCQGCSFWGLDQK